MEKLLTVKEVSELLGVTETTVRRWVMEGKVPSYLVGGARRFNLQEVLEHSRRGADKK